MFYKIPFRAIFSRNQYGNFRSFILSIPLSLLGYDFHRYINYI